MSGDTAEDAQSRAEDAEADEDTDNDEPILSGSGGVSKVILNLKSLQQQQLADIFNVVRSVRSWSLPAGRRFCTPGRPEVRGRGSWRRWCGRGCPRRCGARSGSG